MNNRYTQWKPYYFHSIAYNVAGPLYEVMGERTGFNTELLIDRVNVLLAAPQISAFNIFLLDGMTPIFLASTALGLGRQHNIDGLGLTLTRQYLLVTQILNIGAAVEITMDVSGYIRNRK